MWLEDCQVRKKDVYRMQNCLHKLNLFLLASTLLLTACSATGSAAPGPSIPGLAQTLAAETMTVQEKGALAAGLQPQPQEIQGALPAYEYMSTDTPVPTATLVPILTPFVSNSRVGSAKDCINAAAFVSDVTVPDNEIMKKGQRFTKTWQFKNSGSCTWTPEYSIIFIWGEQMKGETPKPIGKTVTPGQTVEVSTQLQAPDEPGEYQGSWSFQDAEGHQFGTGSEGKQFFWVAIIVPGKLDWGGAGGAGGCKIGGG
jgi:hypothetical protein